MRMMVLLASLALTLPALAQDDDIVPLSPVKKKAAKKKPKAPARPVPPAPGDEDLLQLAPRAGTLLLQLRPAVSGATVAVDGAAPVPLTAEPLSLAPGKHTVLVKRPGFVARPQGVTVASGKQAVLEVPLTAVAAVLSVSSDVRGADVLVDGTVVGVTPLVNVEVTPGTARITLRLDGKLSAPTVVRLTAGEDSAVSLTFAPPAPTDAPLAPVAELTPAAEDVPAVTEAPPEVPVTQRWYFWAGVGAVVAAAVATTVVLALDPANNPASCAELCAGGRCQAAVPGRFCWRSVSAAMPVPMP